LKALIREEEAQARLLEHNDACGYEYESAVDKALHSVFECTGDRISYNRGVLSGAAEPIERVKTRAGLAETANSPNAYTDRSAVLHLPYDQTVELARPFCAAEPGTVLLDVEKTEREWTREAQIPGEGSIVGLLNEYRAAFALIRQWAGYDAAVAEREAHIQRLERLVWDAVYALQKAGLDREAERLRRAIGRS
jgi:hypothetical protein